MTRNNMTWTVLWKPLFRGIISELIPHSFSHYCFSLTHPLDKSVLQAWKEKLRQDNRKHVSLFKDGDHWPF